MNTAVNDLHAQPAAWAEKELRTLDRLLRQRPAEAKAFRDALRRIDEIGGC